MAGKQEVRSLINQLLELIRRLVSSTCFTREELEEIIGKLRQAVDELQRITS